nr:phenoloxidase-activating factor 3-like [Aedes albopictus]XP_029736295.1 phenoloxidase-activating factor 3-like [Aedes albopictus]
MWTIVLMLLVGCWAHLIVASDGIVFEDNMLLEGDRCQLRNGRPGQCRIQSACKTVGTGGLSLCRSGGSQLVVCCDVVQQQCDAVSISVESRVRDHLVGVTEKADVGEFPFMALVIYNTTENRCGATIISDKFLVSAAHCFKKFLFPIKVRVGTTDADDELARTYDIVKIHRHQRYNSVRRVNDIALIEVRDSIIMSRSVQPICLYTESTELPATQNLTVMGWGVDDTESLNVSRSLLKGVVRPILRNDCFQRLNKDSSFVRFNITDGHTCALGSANENGEATDACQGDSGGPLVLSQNDKYYLVGVVSTGPACGGIDLAGIYTWVSKYMDWIIDQKVWRNSLR